MTEIRGRSSVRNDFVCRAPALSASVGAAFVAGSRLLSLTRED